MKKYIVDVMIRKQDKFGNTYHDIKLMDMDGQIITRREKVYGYGHQYKSTTQQILEELKDYIRYEDLEENIIFVVHQC